METIVCLTNLILLYILLILFINKLAKMLGNYF